MANSDRIIPNMEPKTKRFKPKKVRHPVLLMTWVIYNGRNVNNQYAIIIMGKKIIGRLVRLRKTQLKVHKEMAKIKAPIQTPEIESSTPSHLERPKLTITPIEHIGHINENYP